MTSVFILTSFLLWPGVSLAADEALKQNHPEVVRTRAFPEWLNEKKRNILHNEEDLKLHIELQEKLQRDYEDARQDYKKQKKTDKSLEETPSYREHVMEREERHQEREQSQVEFRREKAEERRLLKQAKIDTMAELGLPENRPRFPLEKRSLYGAPQKFFKNSKSGGSSMGGSSGGAQYAPPVDSGFSPPSGFDDFPPAPSFPSDDSFDLPPPPPPPPLPPMEGGDFSLPEGDDLFPPPPPPPMDF